MITIAAATAADVPAIAGVMAVAFDPGFGEAWSAAQYAASLAHPTGLGQVARDTGAVIGFTLIRCAADEAELLLVAVRPEYRRRGIAARLVEAASSLVAARGAAAIFLEVREGNATARALYCAQGFASVGRRPAYYTGHDQRRYDAVTMRRTINPLL